MCQFRFHKTILLRLQTRCFLRTQLKHGQAWQGCCLSKFLLGSQQFKLSSEGPHSHCLKVYCVKTTSKVLLILSAVCFSTLENQFLLSLEILEGRSVCCTGGVGQGRKSCLSWKGSISSKKSLLLSQMNYRNMWLISLPRSKAYSLE